MEEGSAAALGNMRIGGLMLGNPGESCARGLGAESPVRVSEMNRRGSGQSFPDGSVQNCCCWSPSVKTSSKVGPSVSSSSARRSLMFIPTDFSTLSGRAKGGTAKKP